MKYCTYLFQKMGYTPSDLSKEDLVLPYLDFSHDLDEDELQDCKLLLSEVLGIRNISFSCSISLDTINEIIEMIKRNDSLRDSDIKMIIDSKASVVADESIYDSKNGYYDNFQISYFDSIFQSNRCTSFEKYRNMETKINNFVNAIKALNLSPLEQIMIVYDAVKLFNYNKDEENNMRDLPDVLYANNAVCTGYINVFNEVLLRLGFKTRIFNLLIKDDIKHISSIVEVNDSKYGIHGIYTFDPAFDSLKKEDYPNITRTYSYAFFAKSKEENDNLKEKRIPQLLSHALVAENEEEAIKDILCSNSCDVINLIMGFYPDINDDLYFNEIRHNSGNDEVKANFHKSHAEKILQLRERCLSTPPIPFDTIFEVIKNIRKIQYGNALPEEQMKIVLEGIKKFNEFLFDYYYNKKPYNINPID